MQNQKIIEQLGYSAKEAKVYLTALALGEAHISDIAAKAKLPRSSVQTIVDKLQQDGLMNFYVMRRYKYWVAEDPERLLIDLKHREETVRDALPALSAIRKAARTERQDRESNKESARFFHSIADASTLPVLIADQNKNIEYVNAAWEKQYGYSLREVQGEHPDILKSGKTPPEVYERMWAALSKRKMFQSNEIIDRRKDGSLFDLLTTFFRLEHNSRTYYIQILDDVTKQHKRAADLRQSFTSAAEDAKG
jgi:PAS domain S-box-containing protein